MLKRQLKNKLTDEKGSGLVLALMVLMVLSVLGASLGVVTIGSLKLSDANQDSSSAYYIAEAGANLAFEEFEKDVNDAYDKTTVVTKALLFSEIKSKIEDPTKKYNSPYDEDFFGTELGGQLEANVKIMVPNGEGKPYIIESTGEVDGKKRTVQKEVMVKWVEKNLSGDILKGLDEPTLIVGENLNVDLRVISDKTINGSLYLEPTTPNKIKLGNINIIIPSLLPKIYAKVTNYSAMRSLIGRTLSVEPRGVYYYAQDYNFDWGSVTKYVESLAGVRNTNYSKLKLKKGSNVTETTEKYYYNEKLEIEEPKPTIDIGDNDVVFFVDKLIIKKSTVNIRGNGTLTFVVSDEVKITENSKFNSDNKNVRIVLTGTDKKIEIKESKISGQIIAPLGTVTLEDTTVNGSVVARDVSMIHSYALDPIKHSYLNYKEFKFNNPAIESTEDVEIITSGPTLELDE